MNDLAPSADAENRQLDESRIKLEEAAVAILIERIASLPQEVKDDLMDVLMDLRTCKSADDLRDIGQTIQEILRPQSVSKLISHPRKEQAPEAVEKRSQWIGNKIKSFRDTKGWTQIDLAEKSGLPQSHISRLESGKHSPSHATLQKLADVLGIGIGDLDPAY